MHCRGDDAGHEIDANNPPAAHLGQPRPASPASSRPAWYGSTVASRSAPNLTDRHNASVNNDMEVNLRDWLRRSGRDLEMQVARAGRDAGADVIQSSGYVDPLTQHQRETDVIVSFGREGSSIPPVNLVVECKSAPGDHWVAFLHKGGKISSSPIIHHSLGRWYERLDEETGNVIYEDGPEWDLQPIFGGDPSPSSAIVRSDLKKQRVSPPEEAARKSTGGDWANDAVRQAVSASQGLSSDALVTVPVVVTGAQLWETWLGRDNQVELERTEYARVRSGIPGKPGLLVHVMTLSRFETFVSDFAERGRFPGR